MTRAPMKVAIVVGALLAGAIGAELAVGVPGQEDAAASIASKPHIAQPGSPAPIAVAQASPAALEDKILARPLFSPRRRPATKLASTVAPQLANLPRLSGIVVSGNQRTAIFAGSDGRRAVATAPGGHVGTFVVQAIDAETVTLAGPDGTRVLRLSYDPSARHVEPVAPTTATTQQAPFAAASAILPSLRNLAGFGGPPVTR